MRLPLTDLFALVTILSKRMEGDTPSSIKQTVTSGPKPHKRKRPYAFISYGFMGTKLSSSEHLEKEASLECCTLPSQNIFWRGPHGTGQTVVGGVSDPKQTGACSLAGRAQTVFHSNDYSSGHFRRLVNFYRGFRSCAASPCWLPL